MFVADAHCDSLYSQAVLGRETVSVTPESLRLGGVGLQTFALFAGMHADGDPVENTRRMFARAKRSPVPLYARTLPEAPEDAPHGVLSIEGGEALAGSVEILREMDDDVRIRMIALTWNYENEIAHPAVLGSDGGLKPFGRTLIREMDLRGIVADVSHLNEAGFWEVLERAELPPIASHSCCRWLRDVPRNLQREQARALIERGGFIGINFYTGFLTGEPRATMDDVLRHIDSLMELGGEDAVGFGSDFDGIESWPEGLGSPADFPKLLNLLALHGYSEEQIAKIAGKNLFRTLKNAEKMRKITG